MPQKQSWRDDALCANSNFLSDDEIREIKKTGEDVEIANIRAAHKIFFPERGDNSAKNLAVEMCGRCPVQVNCLIYSLNTGPKVGIWGGVSGRDRRRVRRMKKQVKISSTGFTEDYLTRTDKYSAMWHEEDPADFQKLLNSEPIRLESVMTDSEETEGSLGESDVDLDFNLIDAEDSNDVLDNFSISFDDPDLTEDDDL